MRDLNSDRSHSHNDHHDHTATNVPSVSRTSTTGMICARTSDPDQDPVGGFDVCFDSSVYRDDCCSCRSTFWGFVLNSHSRSHCHSHSLCLPPSPQSSFPCAAHTAHTPAARCHARRDGCAFRPRNSQCRSSCICRASRSGLGYSCTSGPRRGCVGRQKRKNDDDIHQGDGVGARPRIERHVPAERRLRRARICCCPVGRLC